MTAKTSRPAVYESSAVYSLVHLTCCNCGVLFGLESGYVAARRLDHKSFTCPNGHEQGYYGPSKTEQELTATRQQLDAARSLAKRESNRRTAAERSAIAYKGHATRLRNRIAQGFCPAGCDQQFPDIQDHIAAEHPDFTMPEATA